MTYQFDDGGRAAAGFKGKASDCVTRAVAIVTGKRYREVYDAMNMKCALEILSKKRLKRSSARTGISKDTTRQYLELLGYTFTPTMFIGSGCKVHLRADELPTGRIICKLSGHVVAVLDGVIHDTYDCSREGTRCVYGYWSKK